MSDSDAVLEARYKEAKEALDKALCSGRHHLAEKYMFALPRAFVYKDYLWPGLLMTEEKLAELASFKFNEDDVLVCTYPKSGTTWMSELVSLLLHHGDLNAAEHVQLHKRVAWLELDRGFVWVRAFEMFEAFAGLLRRKRHSSDSVKRPRVMFTHLPLELLPESVHTSGCRIIYVARNPKDTAVSFWHFHKMARFLGVQKSLTWADFFTLFASGLLYNGDWFEHVQSYWNLSKLSDRVLFVKYEDMSADLRAVASSIAKWLGLQLSDDVIDAVAEKCRFANMKNNKAVNRDGVWLFDQKVSKFMRKGVVGDYRNHFTLEQNRLFDTVYEYRMRATPDLKFNDE